MHHTTPPSQPARRAAFTLIELLVVVAVIAILIGVLLPALGQARAAAWSIVCQSTQRQLNIGINTYGAENDNWIPGISSSGEAIFGGRKRLDDLDEAHLPVQSFDWITPSLPADDLPDNWAARFDTLLNQYACPANKLELELFGDADAFDEMAEHLADRYGAEESTPPSYLMPLLMQVSGGKTVARPIRRGVFSYTRIAQENWAATKSQSELPDAYMPRLDRISNMPNKVAMTDGMRYIDHADQGATRDFDVSISPGWYGSFTTAGPIFDEAISFPTGTDFWPTLKPLVMRHAGKINISTFDGSGRSLEELEMFNPTLWAPSKSTFNAESDTAEQSLLFFGYEAGDKLN